MEPRIAHDDFSTNARMQADCREVFRNVPSLERAARKAVEPAPSIHFEDFPQEVRKRDITVSEAAARLANSLHLHLD